MENKKEIQVSDVVLLLKGFQRFNKKAVEAIYNNDGLTDETTIQKERAWLLEDGSVLFEFLNVKGDVLKDTVLKETEFRLG